MKIVQLTNFAVKNDMQYLIKELSIGDGFIDGVEIESFMNEARFMGGFTCC